MTAPTTAPSAALFLAWLRTPGRPWRAVASGTSYAKASKAGDEYTAAMLDLPAHCEVYVGPRDAEPPGGRRRKRWPKGCGLFDA
jgi:hypothetical protein